MSNDAANRRAGLPPVRCTAWSKQAGRQCRNWAVIGAQVCRRHGGARPVVEQKGDMKAIAAQLGVRGLPPGETVRIISRVLSDRMLHAAAALSDAAAEGADTAELGAAFDVIADKSLVAARVALAAGVEGQRDADLDIAGELVTSALSEALSGVVSVLPVGVRSLWAPLLESYGFALAGWSLQPAKDRGPRPEAPKLPELPGAVPQQRVAFGELMPAPRRRSASDADDVWRRAQEVVDAEVVEDDEEDDDDGDVGAVAG
jgi:hypothetical protein